MESLKKIIFGISLFSGIALAEADTTLTNTPPASIESADTLQDVAQESSDSTNSVLETETTASNDAFIEAPENDSTEAIKEASLDTETIDFSEAKFPLVKGTRVNSVYGIRKHRLHRGIDLHILMGDSIFAVMPGKVVVSKYNRGGYGHYVMIEHANGSRTLYGHLKERLVKVGDTVDARALIGYGGNTGRSSGPHLHFEIRYGDVNIDPATVYDFVEGTLLKGADKFSLAVATACHNEIQKELSRHRFHKVRSGDTLGKIARMYGTTIEKICRLNNIKRSSILRIGQRLQCS